MPDYKMTVLVYYDIIVISTEDTKTSTCGSCEAITINELHNRNELIKTIKDFMGQNTFNASVNFLLEERESTFNGFDDKKTKIIVTRR